MGLLGWPPQQFWQSTMHDFGAACDGWRIAQGDDPESEKNIARELHAALDRARERKQQ